MRFLILALALSPALASADCRNVQRCDGFNNNCRVMQICDSTLDLPAINPAPLRPVGLPGIRPLDSMDLPPLGTSQCSTENINGRWQRVCR